MGGRFGEVVLGLRHRGAALGLLRHEVLGHRRGASGSCRAVPGWRVRGWGGARWRDTPALPGCRRANRRSVGSRAGGSGRGRGRAGARQHDAGAARWDPVRVAVVGWAPGDRGVDRGRRGDRGDIERPPANSTTMNVAVRVRSLPRVERTTGTESPEQTPRPHPRPGL